VVGIVLAGVNSPATITCANTFIAYIKIRGRFTMKLIPSHGKKFIKKLINLEYAILPEIWKGVSEHFNRMRNYIHLLFSSSRPERKFRQKLLEHDKKP
jgi:hypothetical protein